MENYEENWKKYRAEREQFYSLEEEVDNNIEKYENENNKYTDIKSRLNGKDKIIAQLEVAKKEVGDVIRTLESYDSNTTNNSKKKLESYKEDIQTMINTLNAIIVELNYQIGLNNGRILAEEDRRAEAYERLKRGY